MKHNYYIILDLVKQEFQTKYSGSLLGKYWLILNPLVLLSVYTVIFSFVFKVRLTPSASPLDYALFVFAGLLPWLSFSEGLSGATNSIVANANIIKKVVFPAEIFPVVAVLVGFSSQIIGFVIFLLTLPVLKGIFFWTWLLLPGLIVLQGIFTLGLGYFLASLNVFFRDVAQILGLVLLIWIYATPVLYSEQMVPDNLRSVMFFNPMGRLLNMYRDLILNGKLPDIKDFTVFIIVALLVFLFGKWFFMKTKPVFDDVL